MENKTDKAILHTLRKIEDRQASMDSDMEKDRQGTQDLIIRINPSCSRYATAPTKSLSAARDIF